ncbi:DUF4038 domain-containing protein [Isoptericola sp. NPDC057559]|uniref:apiosidase-like domain-containing protein n=1 Tax=Isoptericola sp. NPDC057559 TaxID=3346168 RepID=UPI0036B49A54
MPEGRAPGRRGRRGRWVAAAALVLVVGLAGVAAGRWWWEREHQGQAMQIPDTHGPRPAELPQTRPATQARGEGPFVARVSDDGRYFEDEDGRPILVRGDSPWSLLVDVAPADAEAYLDDRAGHGVNAIIVSLLGARVNGGPSDDGATADGVLPFVGGDVLRWQPEYWDRAHQVLAAAADRGITVFLYPVDGWTVGHAFVPAALDECRAYGERVATWAADLPNVMWMTGGDYFPATDDLAAGSDVDHCFAQVRAGLRAVGDQRPFSIQLGYPRSVSTENPFWAGKVDFNFVYTYQPTSVAVRQAYDHRPALPALLGEANYERENNDGGPPTTNETLRRQVAWALTSGAAGDFYGSDDWEFLDGWSSRLDTPGLRQVGVVRDVIEALPWWRLDPVAGDSLVVSGRGSASAGSGDVLQSDVLTAAATADGRYAVVYVPTAREIGLDTGALAAGSSARWVDPATGAKQAVGLRAHLRTPGRNADGGEDWLLVVAPG